MQTNESSSGNTVGSPVPRLRKPWTVVVGIATVVAARFSLLLIWPHGYDWIGCVARAGWILLTLGMAGAILRFFKPTAPSHHLTSFQQWIAEFGWGALFGVLACAIASLTGFAIVRLGGVHFRAYDSTIPRVASVIVLQSIWIVILTPVVEEILFRKAILGAFSKILQWPWAIVAQAILFAGMHWRPGQRLEYLIPITITGIILGYVKWWRQSLPPCIIAHIVLNAFAFMPGAVEEYSETKVMQNLRRSSTGDRLMQDLLKELTRHMDRWDQERKRPEVQKAIAEIHATNLMPAEQAIPKLIGFLNSDISIVHDEAWSTLAWGRHEKQAAPYLIFALHRARDRKADDILDIIGVLGKHASTPPVRKAVVDYARRRKNLRSLLTLKPLNAAPELASLFDLKDPRFSRSISLSLRHLTGVPIGKGLKKNSSLAEIEQVAEEWRAWLKQNPWDYEVRKKAKPSVKPHPKGFGRKTP